MSPRTKEQFDEIRKIRKRSIMATALKCFAERGFQTVTVSRVAEEAGISKGLMYNYFESKEALLKEIILDGIRQMMAEVEELQGDEITRETLIRLIERNIQMMKTEFHYWKLYIAVITQPGVSDLIKEELNEMIAAYLVPISAYYQKKGVKNPLAYSLLIGSLMDGIAMDYVIAPEEYPLDDVKNLIIELLI